ncbi:unnamed protein product [Clavelina lepadiformis]|uniref:HTH psq-type domain-containing protein n=1 Tax=Clavelina lepadiformis TaxID=159417 RepID=A0ABP0GC54_CLALP
MKDESDMREAITEQRLGKMSTRALAKKYGISESTFRKRLQREKEWRLPIGQCKKFILSAEIEAELGKIVSMVCNIGFSITNDQIRESVKEYLQNHGIKTHSNTPFVYYPPIKMGQSTVIFSHWNGRKYALLTLE